MPIEAKARPTADNCGWCQPGHATVKFCSEKQKLKEVDLKIALSVRRPLGGQGVYKIPKKLRSKKPNIVLNVPVGSWNLGSISERGVEVSEQMRRRKVLDRCCLQEVRWRGQGTRLMGVKRRKVQVLVVRK